MLPPFLANVSTSDIHQCHCSCNVRDRCSGWGSCTAVTGSNAAAAVAAAVIRMKCPYEEPIYVTVYLNRHEHSVQTDLFECSISVVPCT